MSEVLGPLLQQAVRTTVAEAGPVDVTGILTQMLQMGDEAHNRNRAGTLMLLRDLAPAMVTSGMDAGDVAAGLRFVGGNDHFFLNLAMPACKLALDAARGTTGSTMVVAMSRNGTEFGIQTAGTGDEWFTGPAQVADGLYLGDYGPDDANPDIGDSAITETAGIGGFAMATAPAIVRLVGGSVPDALATTRRMHEITLGENPRWSVPALEFQGVPSGIDVTRVCRTGILPQINTGMAGRVAGVGQVGAGLVTPPAEIFPKALARLAELARQRRTTDESRSGIADLSLLRGERPLDQGPGLVDGLGVALEVAGLEGLVGLGELLVGLLQQPQRLDREVLGVPAAAGVRRPASAPASIGVEPSPAAAREHVVAARPTASGRCRPPGRRRRARRSDPGSCRRRPRASCTAAARRAGRCRPAG